MPHVSLYGLRNRREFRRVPQRPSANKRLSPTVVRRSSVDAIMKDRSVIVSEIRGIASNLSNESLEHIAPNSEVKCHMIVHAIMGDRVQGDVGIPVGIVSAELMHRTKVAEATVTEPIQLGCHSVCECFCGNGHESLIIEANAEPSRRVIGVWLV